MRLVSSFAFSYWKDQHSLLGKVAVVLFHFLVWFMIMTSLYGVLSPASEGTNCILDELRDDEYTLLILNGLIRVLNWFGVGFFVALLFLPSVEVAALWMTVVMCGAWVNNKFFMGQPAMLMDSKTRISQECWESVLSFNAVFAGASVFICCLITMHTCDNTGDAAKRSSEPFLGAQA
eukprot:TRINITY_DN13107_c1_g3_i1.p1 TRINITY_DN13107_c1_g3~~TRINITY_DN13107_c1_g3_i1.p1  ORF type:complete len:177 (-),score=17.98 TRINITY_DN13107_c1_g3_i1:163-693(-)